MSRSEQAAIAGGTWVVLIAIWALAGLSASWWFSAGLLYAITISFWEAGRIKSTPSDKEKEG